MRYSPPGGLGPMGPQTQVNTLAEPVGLRRAFTSLANRNFRVYWASTMCQMAAMNMQMVVQSLLVYRLTHSPAMLGVMSLANALPMLFFSLFGGVIADRVQKKNVLVVGQVVSGLITLTIALALTFDAISWVFLLVTYALQGLVWALIMPSRQSIIPEIVGQEGLTNAIGLNMAAMNINRLLTPALAGLMVAWWDFDAVYYTMAALFIAAAVLITALPPTSTISLKGSGAIRSIQEGLTYVRSSTILLSVLAVTLVMVLLSMPYMMLLPVFTEDVLKVGADRLGVLISASGVGALVGSIFIAALRDKNRGALLMLSALVLGIALVGFSLSNDFYLSLVMMVPIGLGQTGRMALSNALVQSYTEDQYRGRVMSLMMMEFGLTSFSTFGAGVLAQFVGVQWTVGMTAFLLILLSGYVLLFVPQIRRLD